MFSENNMGEVVLLATIMFHLSENISLERTNEKLHKVFPGISQPQTFCAFRKSINT